LSLAARRHTGSGASISFPICCTFARLFDLPNICLLIIICFIPTDRLAKHANMAQIYQKTHYDYDSMQRSERRPSRGPIHTVDRGVPYVAYSTRPDPRKDSRTYVLPTPIHDLGEDSDQGSARKRTSMAVSLSFAAQLGQELMIPVWALQKKKDQVQWRSALSGL
jgi:hypothetical protein